MNKKTFPILLLHFINYLNLFLLVPILPIVIKQQGVSELYNGLIISVYPIFQLLSIHPFANLSERFGRKPILFFTQLGTALSWLLLGSSYFIPQTIDFGFITLPILVILCARIIDGITGGNALVANAYIIDSTEPKDRAAIFAKTEIAILAGSILGPILGNIFSLTPIGYLGACIFAFVLSMITLGFIHFFITESLSEKHVIAFNFLQTINIFYYLKPFAKNKIFLSVITSRLFFQIILQSFISIIFLYLAKLLDIRSNNQFTPIIIFASIVMLVTQLVVAQKIIHRIGEARAFFYGQIIMIIALVSFAVTTNFWLLGIIFIILMVGVSLNLSLFKALLTSSVKREEQTQAIAIEEQVMVISGIIAPLVSTLLYITFYNHIFTLFGVFGLLGIAIVYTLSGQTIMPINIEQIDKNKE